MDFVKSLAQYSLLEMILYRGRGEEGFQGCKRTYSRAWWPDRTQFDSVTGGASNLNPVRVERVRDDGAPIFSEQVVRANDVLCTPNPLILYSRRPSHRWRWLHPVAGGEGLPRSPLSQERFIPPSKSWTSARRCVLPQNALSPLSRWYRSQAGTSVIRHKKQAVASESRAWSVEFESRWNPPRALFQLCQCWWNTCWFQ